VSDVADVFETQGPNEINRENRQRRIYVSANVADRDLVSAVKEIKAKVSQNVKLPVGSYIVYGGQFEAQEAASKKIFLFGSLALLAVALILYAQFRSKMIVGQILLTIPFAYIGGILLLFLVDRNLTIASMIGFITLSGIACRNGIMMISHYLHLMKEEKMPFGREMIIKGSLERLVPVLMTAFVASLALLPLVFAKGQTGSEILHPVALVIVGGLLSSTLLDILVTPTVFLWLGQKSAEQYIQQTKKETLT
jgi:Cu/Ag efflux pump CusA